MKITVKNNNVETALRIFKRKTKESNLMNTLREKEFYEKPSAKRNRKQSAARLRERRRQETNK